MARSYQPWMRWAVARLLKAVARCSAGSRPDLITDVQLLITRSIDALSFPVHQRHSVESSAPAGAASSIIAARTMIDAPSALDLRCMIASDRIATGDFVERFHRRPPPCSGHEMFRFRNRRATDGNVWKADTWREGRAHHFRKRKEDRHPAWPPNFVSLRVALTPAEC